MEKVVYTLTHQPGVTTDEMRDRLCGEVTGRLLDAGVHGVQVNVADAAVAPAAGLRITTSERPADAVVSVWVDSATIRFRRPVDDAIATVADAAAAYLVTESTPLPNTRFPAEPGARSTGFAQLAFLRRREDLPETEWLDIWLNDHTGVALDTQSTFLYVQNVVVRILTAGAAPWDAIVEEAFPADAMTDPHAFFDAVGDDERLDRHRRRMLHSVGRFVDLASIEVIPTSRYVMRPVPGAEASA